MGQGRDD